MCVYVCVSFIMVYILFYIYNIYDLSSMNDVQVVDTGGNRCDRERERERKGEYIQEKTYIIYGYIPSFSLVEHFIR